ncbi:unnamed protein product [Diatraea saccharalis]|uniref:Uncharacterized protein n=1 Tax=Diatraea saccharalis TaxID=40085 RepID=A0A9N9RDR7_9NEOP|nr:unnamed protein product [Diatraea saccharalis]
MEVQAAVEMVSREVTTVPKSPPERRTVAVPLSPSTSSDEQKRKGEVSVQVVANKTKKAMLTYKHAQASVESEDLSVQVMSTSEEQAVFRNATYGSYCFYRQSELEEKLINNNLENELESTKNISDVPKNNPEISDLRRKILKRMSCKLQSLTKNLGNLSDRKMATTGLGKTLQFTPVWVPWGEIQFYTDVSTDIIKNNTQQLNTFTKVYRTSVQSFLIKSQLQQLNIIIKDWIKSLPITTNNSSKCVSDAKVIDMKRIQRIIFQKLKHGTPHEMQAELFNLISNIPMNIQDSLKISYLNQVITSFMKKIRQMTFPNYIGRRNYNIYNIENKTNYNVFKQHNQITKHGLVKITADHLNTYFSNNNLLLDDQGAKYFQTELIDILLQSMQEICDDNVMDVIEEIVLLFGETSRATDNEARIFANQLLAKIKKVINNSILNRTFKDSSINTHSKNYIILQNTSWNKLHHNISNSDISDHQKSLGNKGNVDSTDTYLNQLTQQIEEWLQNSQLNIPANDTRLRQIVIHDLAGDIIDRYKYLCLNVSKRGSDEDEIENLKYQIFKWINKLAGEDNMETLNHAPELMRRIQSIPVPKALQTNDSFKNESLSNGCMMKDCSQSANFQRYSFTRSEMRPSKGFISNTKINSSNISNSFNKRMSKCQQSPSGPSINNGRSMRQLNDEYDDFLKNWVKDLPIPSESSEEQEIAEKARQGIYNGVWKTLVKLKLDPDIFHNVFYYEDALDDELEELLKCLPDTPEIKAKKHLLKVNLIEKTTNTNEKIKSSFAPESYKQQLVENVARDLPLKNRTGTSVNNNNQISEVLQIHKIVDDYILCVNYKETDHSKAEVYRNKLIKEAYILIENMKKTYGQDLKDIDTNLYVNNVLNALQKVPMPQDVIEKEANEIQVSQEVDHWFTDLQVVCRNDHTNKRDKNKIKQALVKKVLELQKDVNIFDCSGKEIIKNEISLFLEKMPMEETNINLDFIAEELTTRLKNKAKDLETSNKRKSVAFLDSVGFYEFSLQMPACSSFSEMPLRPALFDQSSYDIKDGSKVILPSPRNFSYGYNRPPYEIPSNEFFTLEDSQASKPVLNQPAVDNKNFQVEDYPNIMHPKPNPWSKQSQQSAYEDGIRKSPDHVIAQGLPANQSIVRDHITSMSKINQSLNQVSSSVENQEPMKKTCCIRNNQQVIMKSPLIASQEFPENENGINNVPQMMLRPENNISVQQSNIINTSSSVSPYGQGFEGTNRVVGIPQMRINSLTPVSSQPQSNINQRIPIIVETPSRLGFHQQPEQSAHHEVFNSTGNRNLQGSSTTYGQPQGFSTPQNQIPLQEYPLRPDKKNSRRQQISLGNIAQRRLDLHDESSNALDGDESCPCFKRVKINGYEDSIEIEFCSRILNSVQTSFSSINLKPKKSSCFNNRKIKSQDDIRVRKEVSNELIEWMRNVYSDEVSSKFWNDRMKRLLQKLAKPGGEEKIREKIQRYLKQKSNLFSKYDEEKMAQLSENIINKLKKLCLRSERIKNGIRIYRIEIQKSDKNKHYLKRVVDKWLNNIPIGKKDFLNRSIERDDILNFMVSHLEPFLDNIHYDTDNNRSVFKNMVKDLLDEVPIQRNNSIDEFASSLVDYIFGINSTSKCTQFVDSEYDTTEKLKPLKYLISRHLSHILQKINVAIDLKNFLLLEEKLIKILTDTDLTHDTIPNIQKNIHYYAIHVGGLNDNQAKHLSNKLIKYFVNDLCGCKYKNNPDDDIIPQVNIPYPETYYVFHNKLKGMVNIEKNTNKDNNNNNFKQQIMQQVEIWFKESFSEVMFPDKRLHNLVINNLAEDILDRYKYLEMNPSSSHENEVQYLKYQIFKWMNKVAVEVNEEIIDRASELMKRLQNIKVSRILQTESKNKLDLQWLLHRSELERPKIIHQDYGLFNIDPKQERKQVRFYEDIIDDWLDICLFDEKKELFYIQERNEFIHDLAVKLSNMQNKSTDLLKEDLIIQMKKIVSDWATKIHSYFNQEANFTDQSISKLVHAVLSWKTNLENTQNHTNFNHIGIILQNWLSTLPLYENANEVEKTKLMELINNLIFHLTHLNIESCSEIHNFFSTISHQHKKYNIIQENANNFQTYIKELDLYNTSLNNGKFINQKRSSELENKENEKNMVTPHVTVYGFTLQNSSNEKVDKLQNDQNESIKPITEADILANQERYSKRLVKEIDEWLNNLKIPQIHDRGFREVVVNDLAGDIVDRLKYLELNPSCKGTENSELDQLRYQIFKWVNKLVGEEHKETLEHASELMDRIRSIPVPMFTQFDGKNKNSQPQFPNNQPHDENTSSSKNHPCVKDNINTMNLSHNGNINSLGIVGSKETGSNLKESHRIAQSENFDELGALGMSAISVEGDQCNTLVGELRDLPQGLSLQELYGHFDNIFKSKIDELPFETPTTEQEQLANLARYGIYNGIWKTFFSLSEKPDIANDYCLFDLLFEEKIDDMLDCLPQTLKLQRIRHGWKSVILNNLLLMLKYVHAITDKPNIREIISNRINRQMMRSRLISNSEKAQHCFVARTAEAYILSSRYKDEDPIRANIYRQRLMKRLEELAENVKLQNKIEFYEINPSQLCQLAFKILGDVPIPNKEDLQEEVEEIQLGEEIEEWYKDLPVNPVVNETHAHLRKRLREILAKRLRDLEKKIDALGDPSLELERDLKHEISKYLEKDADLKQVNDLNINFMVDELTKRIKNRHENNRLRYEVFEKEMPASSTFVRPDLGEIMAPLVDIQQNPNLQTELDHFQNPREHIKPRKRAYSLPNNDVKRVGPKNQRLSYTTSEYQPNHQFNLGDSTSDPWPVSFPECTTKRERSPSHEFGFAIRNMDPSDQRILSDNILQDNPQHIAADQVHFLRPGNFIQEQPTYSRVGITTSPPAGISPSTARINIGSSGTQVRLDGEMQNKRGKIKYKCHCMDRLPRRRVRACDDLLDYPCCPLIPVPRCLY